jgi:hypothetical protein
MLRVEALKRPFEHLAPDDPNKDSVEWTARAAGYECRITFPGPYLQRQFPPSHPELPTIRRLCGISGEVFPDAVVSEAICRHCWSLNCTELGRK